jgi:pimeloyl-ACP methyl ester carboxylesterase
VVKGLDGRWEGAITSPGGAKVRLVLRVDTGPYGTIANLDSPDQLAYGIRLGGLTSSHGVVTFTAAAVHGAYSGVLSPDGKTISGTWTQRGSGRPLAFTRQAAVQPTARPQTPKPPFPYRALEVSVQSTPGVTLAGTLTEPKGEGPFPAALLITGSGPQDRDETILGHKPFAVLADALTRRGIVVLRLDDRGFGKSTGDFATATEADFVADAQAAVRWLRARPEIEPGKVGLIGHSEGGIIAPKVAAKDPKIAFVVMMAGPGAPMSDVMAAQRLALGPSMGMDAKTLEKINAAIARELAGMKGARSSEEAKARALAVLKADFPQLPQASLEAQASQLSSDWFRDLMAYDPAPTLGKLRMPVLAVIGSKDRQVPPDLNLPALRAALKADPKAKVLELPGLNHLFQTAPTGAPGEYADIEETIAPVALKTIGDWVVGAAR